jgi:hypothetical protein
MRFYDERNLWHSETEKLAEEVENKTKWEIQEILDAHDVVRIRSCDRPKTTMFGRLLFPIVALAFLLVMPFKWIITGNSYFDAVSCKYKWIRKLTDYAGIK